VLESFYRELRNGQARELAKRLVTPAVRFGACEGVPNLSSVMRLIAGVVAAVAALEAAVFAFVPFAQSGAMGEPVAGEPYLEPLATVTYWLTAVPCLMAVAALIYCAVYVTQYPRSARASTLRTGSLIGFALINYGYFAFAICVGTSGGNPAMFGYSLCGLAAVVLACALVRAGSRQLVG
jgi:hypothetical protein